MLIHSHVAGHFQHTICHVVIHFQKNDDARKFQYGQRRVAFTGFVHSSTRFWPAGQERPERFWPAGTTKTNWLSIQREVDHTKVTAPNASSTFRNKHEKQQQHDTKATPPTNKHKSQPSESSRTTDTQLRSQVASRATGCQQSRFVCCSVSKVASAMRTNKHRSREQEGFADKQLHSRVALQGSAPEISCDAYFESLHQSMTGPLFAEAPAHALNAESEEEETPNESVYEDASSDGGSLLSEVPCTEDGSWPDVNPNLMDVVHDVTAALACNDSGDPAWVEVQQVIEAVVNMCTANLHEMNGDLCMELIEYWEALDIMQFNATRTKVKFKEHVDSGS